ncbi:molybdenum ABC transporter ATP-binding protein [Tropicimonas sp.]|uniref:molybdenum ABC transporter ATP-binding protein n=1 Tax=Tropicimonas sp. TaxID=2067044 RepID=UPI003A87935A
MTLTVSLDHHLPGFTLDASFEAPPGITALFGHSGAGKTTIVQAVSGLLRPDRGRIAVGDWVVLDTSRGICLPPHRRRVGYVFQDGRLFPHMNVRRNLHYGVRFSGHPHNPAQTDRIVGMLGIGDLLDRYPAGLSGGEKQRVAIGRALLANPRLLLLDEPLAALDEARKAEIMPYLERMRDEAGVPILYVSHSAAEVARLATTVVVLDHGRVVNAGPAIEVMADPASASAFGPRETGALLAARIVARADDGLTELATSSGRLHLPGVEGAPGTVLRIRIPAHEVIIARDRPEGLSALNILPATIRALRHGEGPGVMVQLECGNDLLLARITRRSANALLLEPGMPCHAIIKSVAVARSDIGGL